MLRNIGVDPHRLSPLGCKARPQRSHCCPPGLPRRAVSETATRCGDRDRWPASYPPGSPWASLLATGLHFPVLQWAREPRPCGGGGGSGITWDLAPHPPCLLPSQVRSRDGRIGGGCTGGTPRCGREPGPGTKGMRAWAPRLAVPSVSAQQEGPGSLVPSRPLGLGKWPNNRAALRDWTLCVYVYAGVCM